MIDKNNLVYQSVQAFQEAYPTKAEKKEALRLMTDEQIDQLISTSGSIYGKFFYVKFKKGG